MKKYLILLIILNLVACGQTGRLYLPCDSCGPPHEAHNQDVAPYPYPVQHGKII